MDRKAHSIAVGLAAFGAMAATIPIATGIAAQDPDDVESISALGHRVQAAPVQSEITLDGRMDEAAWAAAEVAEGFVQMRPDPGAPASQPTEVRVLYDDSNLYVGMRLYDDDPDGIAAQLGRRGATDLYSDWAHVIIDSYHDRRTAFRFSLSPAGVRQDALHYDDSREDDSWEAVWEGAATVDSLGWTAEFRIPLSQLRFTLEDGKDPVWGINFARDIARLDESSSWSPIPQDSDRVVSRSGTLHGLSGLGTSRRLEVTPYTLAQAERNPGDEGDPFQTSGEVTGDVGVDASYGLGPNLTLTATLNPDFGQVEVDPAVVNLSAFETFFPERRPFFMEGADIFDFDINVGDGGQENLFYSRRIGRAPQGSVPGEAQHADVPSSSSILAAAKLSGRTRSGWSLGAMSAVTDREVGRWADRHGELHRRAVEPRTHYGVLRASRNFRDGGSALGAMATAVNRERLVDGTDFLASEAYVAGVDGRHRFGEDQWEATGWLAGSLLQGTPDAMEAVQRAPGRYFQRPDAHHVSLDPDRTSLSGVGGDLTVSKVAGQWRGGALLQARSPGFEANDLGFQQDRDMAMGAVWLGRVSFEAGEHLRNWNLFTNLYRSWNSDRAHLFTGGNVNGSFETVSGWGGHGGIEGSAGGMDPVATRGGPALHRPSYGGFWGGLFTDRRRSWYVQLDARGMAEAAGTGRREISLNPTLTVRPSPRLETSIGPAWERNRDPAQYVGQEDADGSPHYVFGELDQTTVSMDARLNVTFTPELSLELFAQPFVSVGHYSAYRRVDEPRAEPFHHRYHTFDADAGEIQEVDQTDGAPLHGVFTDGGQEPAYTFADPGFRMRSLRGNAVLRWEFRPGSTLFLVWQQDRATSDPAGSRFDFSRDTRGIADAPGEHVFAVKVSYWLGR